MSRTIDTSRHAATLQSIEFGARPAQFESLEITTIENLIEVEALHQTLLGRDVIVRRLTAEGNALTRVRRAFLQEIRATASLRHAGVAQVYEASNGVELPYAVIEQVAGTTLQANIDTRYDNGDALPAAEARHIIDVVAGVVEYAHEQGVRVYDLRPSNIVLAESGAVVLQSLGMAPVEIERLAAGQLAYLAPEYVCGIMADERAEVYALGALLAHILTGAAPFEGGAEAIIAQKELASNAPRLFAQGLAPDALALLQVARAALHPNVQQRPATVRDFRAALVGLQPGLSSLPAMPTTPTVIATVAPAADTPLIEASDDTFVMPPMADASLVPGMERPEFQAALAFTVLVPLPAAPEAAPATLATPTTTGVAGGISVQLWVVLLLAIVVSVSAAMMLG